MSVSSPSKYALTHRSSPSPKKRFTSSSSSYSDRKSLHEQRVIDSLQVEKDLFERRCKELTQTNQALQSEIDALVTRIQDKSAKNIELNNSTQHLQQTVSQLQCEIISLTKDKQQVSNQNNQLVIRQRELEELGREMNNISIEASIRERDLESELQQKARDLMLRDEVLEKNKANAELLERKIEELRYTTNKGITARDEIIQQQSEEMNQMNQTLQETRSTFEARLEGMENDHARELDNRDQLIQRYMARIKKQATKIETLTRASDTLQARLDDAAARERDLERSIQLEAERGRASNMEHQTQMDEQRQAQERHLETIRQLRQQVGNGEDQMRKLMAQIARKDKETDALVEAQQQQIKAHQLDQQEWADKLLRQEIIHEKEKDELALRLQCRECPHLAQTIKRQKVKLKKQAEQIKLFTLAYPKRAHAAPSPRWTPPGNPSAKTPRGKRRN